MTKKPIDEGLGNALRRATGAKTTLGAVGAAAGTIAATTAAGALVGGSTFAAPGAVIGGGYALASILNRMRKKKIKESEMDEGFFSHLGKKMTMKSNMMKKSKSTTGPLSASFKKRAGQLGQGKFMGQSGASGGVREEVETLDELSKKTIGKYIKRTNGTPEPFKLKNNKDKDARRKFTNRFVGRSNAKDRMQGSYVTKGSDGLKHRGKKYHAEDFINELSLNTLGKYAKKTKDSLKDMSDRNPKNYKKRRGLERACDRMGGKAYSKKGNTTKDYHAEERIDELSKGVLKSYLKKAQKDIDSEGGDILARGSLIPDSRYKGVIRAKKKLAKEDVETINELSKTTLGNYVKKASRSLVDIEGKTQRLAKAARHGNTIADKAAEKSDRKFLKRDKGISNAIDRMQNVQRIQHGKSFYKRYQAEDVAALFEDWKTHKDKHGDDASKYAEKIKNLCQELSGLIDGEYQAYELKEIARQLEDMYERLDIQVDHKKKHKAEMAKYASPVKAYESVEDTANDYLNEHMSLLSALAVKAGIGAIKTTGKLIAGTSRLAMGKPFFKSKPMKPSRKKPNTDDIDSHSGQVRDPKTGRITPENWRVSRNDDEAAVERRRAFNAPLLKAKRTGNNPARLASFAAGQKKQTDSINAYHKKNPGVGFLDQIKGKK